MSEVARNSGTPRRARRRRLLAGASIGAVVILGITEGIGSVLKGQVGRESLFRIEVAEIFALTLLMLNIHFAMSEGLHDEAQDELKEYTSKLEELQEGLERASATPRGTISAVSHSDAMADLVAAIRRARYRIFLCNTNKEPPRPNPKLDALLRAKSQEGVAIRRIVFLSEPLLPWLRALIQAYEGRTGTTLAVIEGSQDVASLLFPCQLVDEDRAFVFGLQTAHVPRPIHLEIVDSGAAQLIETYYDEVWTRCTVLVDNGQPIQSVITRLLGKWD